MNANTLSNLLDLIGMWSCVTLAAGLSGAGFGYLNSKRSLKFPVSTRARISMFLAAGMFLFSGFVAVFVVPLGKAYGGAPERDFRHIRVHDKYFAAMIALTFSAAFAFDAWQLRRGTQ